MPDPGTRTATRLSRGLGGLLAACFARAADFLWGCRHRKTTMPITLPSGESVGGRAGKKSDTYIVCLDCGRNLAYDWAAKFSSPASFPPHRQPATAESQQRPVSPATPGHPAGPGEPPPHNNENTP